MSEPARARKSLRMIKDDVQYEGYQIDGIRLMAKMRSFLLADPPGLGKTLQALTVAAIDWELGAASRALVVSPATLKWNWLAEIEAFTNFSAMVLDGTPAQRAKQLRRFAAGGTDILVAGYEQVAAHLDSEREVSLRKKATVTVPLLGLHGAFAVGKKATTVTYAGTGELNDLAFDIVVFDEAHAIKDPSSIRTKAALALRAGRYFLLTGSPILNNVHELWPLLHLIDRYEYPNYWAYVHRYCVYGGYKDKQIVGVKNQAELVDRLNRVMIRRPEAVLGLDEPKFVPVVVELHPEQRRLYTQASEELRIDLPADPNPMELENALVKFLRLQQICGTTACIEGYDDHSLKLDWVEEMVAATLDSDEHIALFTRFRPVLACIEARLRKAGATPFVLHGDVPAVDRVPLVKAWGATKASPIIAMHQVAGVGLNMTAACKGVTVDDLYVPELNKQTWKRLHRKGQTRPVVIYQPRCRNTIESRIKSILDRKRRLIGSTVEASDWKRALYQALRDSEESDEQPTRRHPRRARARAQ